MKKILLLAAFTSVLMCLILPFKVNAQNLQDFKFEKFEANYYLNRESDKSSTLSVNETLVAIFPEYDQNHGIARAIPITYEGHSLRLNGLSVTDEKNNPKKYTTEEQNDNLIIKIQDPDVYVHGKQTYKINYKLHDVVKFFPTHDELFWDINGDQWAQKFDDVMARIHVPEVLADNMNPVQKCYVGAFGSTDQKCNLTSVKSGTQTIVSATKSSVEPNQTMSIALSFKSGTFDKSQQWLKYERSQNIQLAAAFVLAIFIPLGAFIFMFRRWRKFGNDPKGRGIIIPEYEPPKGFDPINSDFLLKQQLRNLAISATIIDMAIKGYITIYEIPKQGLFGNKDYELLLKNYPSNVSPETLNALKIIFGDALATNTKIKVSDFKKSRSMQKTMYEEMKKLESSLATNLHQKGFFIKNPKKVKQGYLIWGSIIAIGGFFSSLLLSNITSSSLVGGLMFGLIAAGILVLIFAFIMPAKTHAGVQANDSLLGLKEYIKLAEADRLKFLQSPEGAEKITDKEAFDPKTPQAKVKLFEKLLPYAILFGLEKDWAKQFNDLYITPPDWYQGGNWTAFNAGYLAGSLSSFNSATGSSFASPSSSSSSGFSGGVAGGGGGGGGGGGI